MDQQENITSTAAEEKAAEEAENRVTIYVTLILIVFILILINYILRNPDWTFKKLSCSPVFSSVEIALAIGFIVLTVVALHKYIETKALWTREWNINLLQERNKGKGIFNELAICHRKLSQLWFTISLAILCGGLIYAAFH